MILGQLVFLPPRARVAVGLIPVFPHFCAHLTQIALSMAATMDVSPYNRPKIAALNQIAPLPAERRRKTARSGPSQSPASSTSLSPSSASAISPSSDHQKEATGLQRPPCETVPSNGQELKHAKTNSRPSRAAAWRRSLHFQWMLRNQLL